MKLQAKLLLSLLILFLAITVGIFYNISAQKERFKEIHALQTKEFLNTFHEIIDLKVSKINAFAFDNTYWDEMIDFLSSTDPQWARINIDEPTEIFGIEYAYLVNTEGKLVYYHQTDTRLPDIRNDLDIPFNFDKPVFNTYFIRSDVGPIQLFIAPIQPSYDNKRLTKPQGYLVVGKVWTPHFVQDFGRITKQDIELDTAAPLHQHSAYYPLKGKEGQTLYRLGITLHSPAVSALNEMLSTQIVFLSLIALFGTALSVLFIYRTILLPVRKLSASMAENDSTILQPLLNGKDELSDIARLIGQFFTQQQTLQEQIIRSDESEREQRRLKNELLNYHAILEQKVEERTKELEEINHTLDERVRQEIVRQREQEQILIQQSRFAAMGEMIGNIAHQWRQPLNALSLLLQNIEVAHQTGRLDNTFIHRVIEKGGMLTNSMSSTIDDFRNFFKPNQDKKLFPLSEAIQKTTQMLHASFKEHLIGTDIDIEENLDVYGFPNELSQVLLNIFSNAQDVLIERQKGPRRIHLRAFRDTETVYIEISDNAGGIEESIIDKIFDPYFTTKEEGKGTGIGLYMSKVIIEKNMEGKLSVSNTHEGARFTITLYTPHSIQSKKETL